MEDDTDPALVLLHHHESTRQLCYLTDMLDRTFGKAAQVESTYTGM